VTGGIFKLIDGLLQSKRCRSGNQELFLNT